jgi:hypothetical protein
VVLAAVAPSLKKTLGKRMPVLILTIDLEKARQHEQEPLF